MTAEKEFLGSENKYKVVTANLPEVNRGNKGKNSPQKKFLWIFLIIGSLLIFLLTIVFLFILNLKDLPSPSVSPTKKIAAKSNFYDRTGQNLLFTLEPKKSEKNIPLKEISPYLAKAIIATEDKKFLERGKFSFQLTANGLQSESYTITKRLIDNTVLGNKKSAYNDLKTIILSLEIEARYSKEEILQMYLNESYYGFGLYGAKNAAETYFGKEAKNLTLGESTALAAMRLKPFLTPYGTAPDNFEIRRQAVLNEMLLAKMIDDKEFASAKEEKINFKMIELTPEAPYFALYALEYFEQKFSDEEKSTGGLKVTTSLDFELQKIAKNLTKNQEFSTASLLVLDPRNGQVLTLEKLNPDNVNDGQFVSFFAPKKIGSAIAPYAYAGAFKKGYTSKTVLFDAKTHFTTNLEPQNYDQKFRGPVSMGEALSGNLAVPNVETFYLAGRTETVALAQKMGLTSITKQSNQNQENLGFVLEGGEGSLFEAASAIGVFAADGKKVVPAPILLVTNSNGKTLFDRKKYFPEEEVLDKDVARQINAVLSDNEAKKSTLVTLKSNFDFSPYNLASTFGYSNLAGSVWTFNYAPNIIIGLYGEKIDTEVKNQDLKNLQALSKISQEYSVETYKKRAPEEFVKPKDKFSKKLVLDGELILVTGDLQRNNEAIMPEKITTLITKKKYCPAHNILYYVSKDNPEGGEPSLPSVDPQFHLWESAAALWITENGYCPKESVGKPSIRITSPEGEALAQNSFLVIKTDVEEPLGVKNVEFFLDGEPMLKDYEYPFELTLEVDPLHLGWHSITAKVYEKNGQNRSSTIQVNPDLIASKETVVTVTNPKAGAVLTKNDFPLTVTSLVRGDLDIARVEFYLNGTLATSRKGDKTNRVYGYDWTYPNFGTFTLQTVIHDGSGKKIASPEVKIEVKK